MGNSQSVPSADRQDSKRLEYSRRKLSKPRVGNHSGWRDIWFQPPSAIIGGRASNAKNEAVREISSAALRQQAIWGGTSIPDLENETTTLQSLSYSRQPPVLAYTRNQSLVLAGSYRGTPRPLSRYSCSTLTSQNVRPELEATDLQYPPPNFMRRRSQIFAASRATSTRRKPTSTLEGSIPAPQLPALDLAEKERAQTPSGYSVLGGFKRGSLRIVNTTVSPASPTQDARPRRRNTSPAHGNTSTHSFLTVTPTPQLAITSVDNEGYFGNYGMLTVSNPTANDPLTPGEVHETLTPGSFETAPEGPEEVSRPYQASQIHVPPIVDLPKIKCTTAFPDINIMPSELQRTGQQMDTSTNYALAQPSAHELHPSLRSHKTVDSSGKSPTPQSASFNSSINSDTQETNHTQRSSTRRPSMKAGTDSGYCSTRSIKSWQSWSANVADGDFHTACTTPSAENPEPEVTRGQLDTKMQSPQIIRQDEVPLKSTDKYRIRATLEGPIFEETVLHGRAQRPSLQIFLTHKRRYTKRLRSVVSSGDLGATRNLSLCLSIDKHIHIFSPDSNASEPSTHVNRKLAAGNSSSSDGVAVDYTQTQNSPSSQTGVGCTADDKQCLHNPRSPTPVGSQLH